MPVARIAFEVSQRAWSSYGVFATPPPPSRHSYLAFCRFSFHLELGPLTTRPSPSHHCWPLRIDFVRNDLIPVTTPPLLPFLFWSFHSKFGHSLKSRPPPLLASVRFFLATVSSVPLPSLSKVSSMEDVSSAGGVVGMGLNLGLHVGNKENDSSNNLLNLQQQQAPPASPLAPTPPTPPSAAATAETTAAAPVAAPELPSPASSSSPLESATNADPAPMSPKPSAVVEAAAAAVAATAAAAGAEPALPLSPGYFGAGARGAGPAVGGGVGVDGGTAAAGVAVAAVAAAAADTPPARPEQKNRKRCFTCSKKVRFACP